MNRLLAVLAVVVAIGAFGVISGTASAHHNNDPKCYEESQVWVTSGHWEWQWNGHGYSHVWVDTSHFETKKVEVPCNTPCEDGQAGEFVETTGCQDPCGDGQVGDFEPNCEDPTCENGGIDSESDECHEFFDICSDGQIIQVRDDSQVQDTDDCGTASLCIDGDIVTGIEYDLNQHGATNDCDPVRLCVDDEHSATVTKFDAEGLLEEGATKGSCTPTETPPPTITTTVAEVEQTQVEQAVEAAFPPVVEVAVLPSAGYGDTSTGFAWTALAALSLIGIGGGLFMVARRS
jgi:hypothetical protein